MTFYQNTFKYNLYQKQIHAIHNIINMWNYFLLSSISLYINHKIWLNTKTKKTQKYSLKNSFDKNLHFLDIF